MTALYEQHCQAYSNIGSMNADSLAELLLQLKSWQLNDQQISKSYNFKNYYQTIAFVNAVAYIAHEQDHHPDIQFGYNRCTICFTTHSIGGLSMNDFICAARIDHLNT